MKKNNKTIFPAVLMVCASIGLYSVDTTKEVPKFSSQPMISRCMEIKSEPALPIAANGKALCEVVVPEKSSSMLRLAGSQLAFYLGKMIGTEVPVKSKISGQTAAFVLGEPGAKLANFDLTKLDRDGYIIKTVGNRIVIAGNDSTQNIKGKVPYYQERGTLYGVYEFLERFGGVRFYFPGEMGTVVPRKPDWKLPQINIIDRPDNPYRQIYYGKGALGKKITFYSGIPEMDLKSLFLFQMRLSTINIPFTHGLAFLGLVQRFGKTHPEYFALRDNGQRHNGSNITSKHDVAGQLCYSSDALKQEIFLDAKAFLTGQPASSRGVIMPGGKSGWMPSRFSQPFFSLSPNDALYKCRCPKCFPEFSKGAQASSNLIWKFMADIAGKLKREGVPGYVTMGGYSCYSLVPEVELPDNFVLNYCLTGPWNENNPVAQEKNLQQLKAWKKKAGRNIIIHTYVCKTGGRAPVLYIPAFTPKAVGSFFRKAAPDISGSFLEAETDYWIFNFMNYYVFSKLMWDVSTDVNALMEEHLRLMYGPAAAEMKEFYDTLERHWMKDIIGKIVDTPLGPQPIYPTYFNLWTKIYSPTEIERINQLFDRAEKSAANDPEALKRVKFMRKEMWGPVLEGAEVFKQSANNRKLWTLYAPSAEKITIDGKLDESAWQKAKPIWLRPSREGLGAEVHTRVRMLADRDNYYVGIECDEPHTDKMVCAKRRKDEIEMWRDNLVELFFASGTQDSFIYQIMLTSAGDSCDLRAENRQLDSKWNSGLEYKRSIVPGKMWIAEVRIPRKSMPELKADKLVANFSRGRILTPECKVKVPYYKWFPSVVRQNAENCGTVILGIEPESQSVIDCGDFDFPDSGKPKGKVRKTIWRADGPMTLDRQFFMTKGQSFRMELPGGTRMLRQFIAPNRLQPGTRYRLSFYLKLEKVVNKKNPRSGFFMDIRFGKRGKDNVLMPLKPSLRESMDWVRYQFEFTAPEETGSVRNPYLGFYLPKEAEGKVWIDHVEMVQVESAEK